MHKDCRACFNIQAEKLIKKHIYRWNDANTIRYRFEDFLNKSESKNLLAPEIARQLNNYVKEYTDAEDLYADEKKAYNRMILEMYESMLDSVKKSSDPFRTALFYALSGNIIDFGPPRDFNVSEVFNNVIKINLSIDHSEILKEELKKANVVLYLGDNAGEIVTDRLFIKTIRHSNMYYAVRGNNILNDVTIEDAYTVKMDRVARVISNGYDAPSTLLDKCSPEFLEVYHSADVIISKGQGNLEGLINVKDKKIFFLLMVKCHVMAELTGAQEGDIIVWYNRFNHEF
ncbi:MAG: DUF89 family protein [Bacteroidales bacterium]|nr:DUF89 family protein [Bacteroidales bacterium]